MPFRQFGGGAQNGSATDCSKVPDTSRGPTGPQPMNLIIHERFGNISAMDTDVQPVLNNEGERKA